MFVRSFDITCDTLYVSHQNWRNFSYEACNLFQFPPLVELPVWCAPFMLNVEQTSLTVYREDTITIGWHRLSDIDIELGTLEQ